MDPVGKFANESRDTQMSCEKSDHFFTLSFHPHFHTNGLIKSQLKPIM